MVDIVVAVSVFCGKMLVNHSAIIQRGNILVAAFALLVYVWHILTNANDLACSDRRVWPAGVPFVLFEVIQKDLQNIVKRVNTTRIHARCYLSEFFKVKDHLTAPFNTHYAKNKEFLFKSECGNESFPYTCEQLGCSLLLFSLFLCIYIYVYVYICFSTLPHRVPIGGLLKPPSFARSALSICDGLLIASHRFINVRTHHAENGECLRR